MAEEYLEGTFECADTDRYICINGKWVLAEENSEICGYTPEECTPGTFKCEDYDLYECIDGSWQLVEEDSTQCGYTPSPPKKFPWFILFSAGLTATGLLYSYEGGK